MGHWGAAAAVEKILFRVQDPRGHLPDGQVASDSFSEVRPLNEPGTGYLPQQRCVGTAPCIELHRGLGAAPRWWPVRAGHEMPVQYPGRHHRPALHTRAQGPDSSMFSRIWVSSVPRVAEAGGARWSAGPGAIRQGAGCRGRCATRCC